MIVRYWSRFLVVLQFVDSDLIRVLESSSDVMMANDWILDNRHQSIAKERMFSNEELDLILMAFLAVDGHHLNEEKYMFTFEDSTLRLITFGWHLKVIELFGNDCIIIFVQCNQ